LVVVEGGAEGVALVEGCDMGFWFPEGGDGGFEWTVGGEGGDPEVLDGVCRRVLFNLVMAEVRASLELLGRSRMASSILFWRSFDWDSNVRICKVCCWWDLIVVVNRVLAAANCWKLVTNCSEKEV